MKINKKVVNQNSYSQSCTDEHNVKKFKTSYTGSRLENKMMEFEGKMQCQGNKKIWNEIELLKFKYIK